MNLRGNRWSLGLALVAATYLASLFIPHFSYHSYKFAMLVPEQDYPGWLTLVWSVPLLIAGYVPIAANAALLIAVFGLATGRPQMCWIAALLGMAIAYVGGPMTLDSWKWEWKPGFYVWLTAIAGVGILGGAFDIRGLKPDPKCELLRRR